TLSRLSIMAGGAMFFPFNVHGRRTHITNTLFVGAPVFFTMQISVFFCPDIEDCGGGAALVVQEVAKKEFPRENPVGQHIAAPRYVDDVEIVGVSANAKYGDFRGQSKAPVVYVLYSHASRPPIAEMIFELRTAGNPLTYANTVREIVRKADPGI